jgi:hypothetical protein
MDLGADDMVDAFRRRMTFAQALGAEYIISNASSGRRATSCYPNMARLADCARSMGITIRLENPGDGDDQALDVGAHQETLPAARFQFVGLPLKIKGTTGSPIRAVAIIEDKGGKV